MSAVRGLPQFLRAVLLTPDFKALPATECFLGFNIDLLRSSYLSVTSHNHTNDDNGNEVTGERYILKFLAPIDTGTETSS